jgi:hypothetical protein
VGGISYFIFEVVRGPLAGEFADDCCVIAIGDSQKALSLPQSLGGVLGADMDFTFLTTG